MPTNAAASRKVRNEQSWHKILITICAYCVKLNFKVTKKFVQAQHLYECVCWVCVCWGFIMTTVAIVRQRWRCVCMPHSNRRAVRLDLIEASLPATAIAADSKGRGENGRRKGGADQAVCHAYSTKSCHATHNNLLSAGRPRATAVATALLKKSSAFSCCCSSCCHFSCCITSCCPFSLATPSLLLLIAHSKKTHNFFGKIKCKL